ERDWLGPLHEMAALAMDLRRLRMARGSIDFDLPEAQIVLDLTGAAESIVRSPRTLAHQIIEEFMLRANEAAATRMFWRKAPFVYRIHEAPDGEQLEAFSEFIAAFGLQLPGGGRRPADFQELLERVKGRPEERSVNKVLLRTMKQARYAAHAAEHFGLASERYTHFTSPIRRYPDLVVHRLVRRTLLGEKQIRVPEDLEAVAEACSRLERASMAAEREIVDYHKCRFMEDKVGDTFKGHIAGVTAFGVFVELEEYFVEGLVHLSTLADDYYHYDERRHSLQGERTKRLFRIGDPLTVRLAAVGLAQRRLDFELADGPKRPAERKTRR
ncbi:MAG: RNB domain-containing ribonuclease, partial [Candidatus Methylomirabilis sp.]|nr:RNB domain-containing ribonuclease [Deltaproteobacteria bacterium]